MLTKENGFSGPMKARADLVEMLMCDPEVTEALVTIIKSELKEMQESDAVSQISGALHDAATRTEIENTNQKNILYWLTQTGSDVRQMILVQTIKSLLEYPECRQPTLDALEKISSRENVSMVMEWVNRNILTLEQAVYVLLYPEASSALQ
ncbi:MAG: hypothetical protein R6V83_09960 [Candidatus Thorarchaeota archaeon]